MITSFRKPSLMALCLVVLAASQAMAQPAQNRRIRGTIESLDGQVLTVKAHDGGDVRINLADNWSVSAYSKADISDIKVNSFIGVGGTPRPDGSQQAVSINIFPESARGIGEGFRPWDQAPNGTMTNANVAQAVTGVDGHVLTLKYKDGEKKIVVAPNTPIMRFERGDRTELKPGAAVAVSAVTKPDGSLESSRVGIGRDGAVP